MGNLQFVMIGFFKFLFCLAIVVATTHFTGEYLYNEGKLLQSAGLRDEEALFWAAHVVAIIGSFLGGLVVMSRLLRMESFSRFVFQCLIWFGSVFCVLAVLGFLYVSFNYVGLTGFSLVLALVAGVVGSYLGYQILTLLVGFLGHEFEKLGNALPSGRSVLFAEALNAGYNKPQTRAFIMELSRDSGPAMGAGGVYTTLILYVIPAFISIVIFFKVI